MLGRRHMTRVAESLMEAVQGSVEGLEEAMEGMIGMERGAVEEDHVVMALLLPALTRGLTSMPLPPQQRLRAAALIAAVAAQPCSSTGIATSAMPSTSTSTSTPTTSTPTTSMASTSSSFLNRSRRQAGRLLRKALLDSDSHIRSLAAVALPQAYPGAPQTLIDWLVSLLMSPMHVPASGAVRHGAAEGLAWVCQQLPLHRVEHLLLLVKVPLAHPHTDSWGEEAFEQLVENSEGVGEEQVGGMMLVEHLSQVSGGAHLSSLLHRTWLLILSSIASTSHTLAEAATAAAKALLDQDAHGEQMQASMGWVTAGLRHPASRCRTAAARLVEAALPSLLAAAAAPHAPHASKASSLYAEDRLEAALGPLHARKMLAWLYLANCDSNHHTRDAAAAAWKATVMHPPRVVRRIMPLLATLVPPLLAPASPASSLPHPHPSHDPPLPQHHLSLAAAAWEAVIRMQQMDAAAVGEHVVPEVIERVRVGGGEEGNRLGALKAVEAMLVGAKGVEEQAALWTSLKGVLPQLLMDELPSIRVGAAGLLSCLHAVDGPLRHVLQHLLLPCFNWQAEPGGGTNDLSHTGIDLSHTAIALVIATQGAPALLLLADLVRHRPSPAAAALLLKAAQSLPPHLHSAYSPRILSAAAGLLRQGAVPVLQAEEPVLQAARGLGEVWARFVVSQGAEAGHHDDSFWDTLLPRLTLLVPLSPPDHHSQLEALSVEAGLLCQVAVGWYDAGGRAPSRPSALWEALAGLFWWPLPPLQHLVTCLMYHTAKRLVHTDACLTAGVEAVAALAHARVRLECHRAQWPTWPGGGASALVPLLASGLASGDWSVEAEEEDESFVGVKQGVRALAQLLRLVPPGNMSSTAALQLGGALIRLLIQSPLSNEWKHVELLSLALDSLDTLLLLIQPPAGGGCQVLGPQMVCSGMRLIVHPAAAVRHGAQRLVESVMESGWMRVEALGAAVVTLMREGLTLEGPGVPEGVGMALELLSKRLEAHRHTSHASHMPRDMAMSPVVASQGMGEEKVCVTSHDSHDKMACQPGASAGGLSARRRSEAVALAQRYVSRVEASWSRARLAAAHILSLL